MRINTLGYRLAPFLFAFSGLESYAQVASYNPFFVTSYVNNYYHPDAGQLTISSVQVLPNATGEQPILQNVILQHRGGVNFELVGFDEVSPEQECTRAEVSKAIPQLEFGMTVAEAEALIGCAANLQGGRVDLETGREVFASWVGNDGMANSRNAGIVGGYLGSSNSVWIGGTSGSSFSSFPTTTSAPYITFSLRENVLEYISYSATNQFRFCYNAGLLDAVRQVSIGDDYADVVSTLNCEGNLQAVIFNDTLLQQQYSWQAPLSPQSGIPAPIPGDWTRQLSETIQMTVVDDIVQSFSYQSQVQVSVDTSCSIDDLVAAQSSVQVGQLVTDAAELLDCGIRTESLSLNGLSETTNYRWYTTEPSESFFVSANRSLDVSVVDGVVRSVRLGRF